MHLDIPSGEFAGYIFDLDGTLIDTMPLHYQAWDRAMRADPAPPPASADAAARDRWAHDVALRRAFGDPNAAPPAPVRAVVAPVAAPSGAAGGRREGC